MKTPYRERNYAYGTAMLTLRTAIGLTQKGLATLLGVSRRAVGEWETGNSYPKAEHLKKMIVLAVKQQAFPAGHEAEEIRLLWQAAHQKVLLDERWLSTVLSQQRSSQEAVVTGSTQGTIPTPPVEETMSSASVMASRDSSDNRKGRHDPDLWHEAHRLQQAPQSLRHGPRVDWSDALVVPMFYGREEELALLSQWVVQERSRVVSVLGMGGIGKSALSVNIMHQLADHFEVVIFRSLRYAPSCEALLDDCLQTLSSQPLEQPQEGTIPTEQRIRLLLEHLRKTRTLLVLDNLEGLIQEGDVRGHLRPDFEEYGQLLRRVAETNHQSTLLLTSREKSAELRPLEGKHAAVRSLRLKGLDVAACKQLLAEKELVGTESELTSLIEVYGGNPLALKIVAETITDLFGGMISEFMTGGTLVFGSITDLLSEQFACLSAIEQSVLRCLAIAREPVTLDELLAMLVIPLPRVRVLEAIDAIHRRSLIEPGKRPGSFMLQPVMQEYVTTVLNAKTTSEIQQD